MKLLPHPLALLALSSSTIISASPISDHDYHGFSDRTSIECVIVNVVVKALSAYSSASPFCASFLGIPSITKTITSTVSLSPQIHTKISTGTATIIPIATSYATTVVTDRSCSTISPPTPIDTYILPSSTGALAGRDYGRGGRPLPPVVAGFASPQISQACSCLTIPTPTAIATKRVTVSPSSTSLKSVLVTVSAPTSTTTLLITSTVSLASCPTSNPCDKYPEHGYDWAYFDNISGGNSDDTYSSFVPEDYKGIFPLLVGGGSGSIGGSDTASNAFWKNYGFDSPPRRTDYFILMHRGYIFARENGTYTFTFESIDEAVYVWIGPKAYSGWTAANANIEVSYRVSASSPGRGNYTIDLIEGQYYPLRIMFAQAQGDGSLELSVAAPDGTVFLSDGPDVPHYLVRYSCGSDEAPPFPDYGLDG